MSPPVEFEFTPDRRYARRLFARTSRPARAAQAAVVVVLVLAGFGAVTADAWAIVAGLLALAVGFALAVRLVVSTGLGVQRVPEAWFAPRQYTVDDEEMAVHSARFTAAYRWDAVARVSRTSDAFVIHLASVNGFVDLPTTPMTAEHLEIVSDILTKHGLLERTPAARRP